MLSFLKSHVNRIIICILVFFILLLSSQIALSFFICKYKPRLVQYFNNITGYSFALNKMSFSYLKGLHLKGVSIFFNNQDKAQDRASIFFKDAFIRIKVFPIFLKKIVITRISINESILLSRKEIDGINLQIIFSDIYKKISDAKSTACQIYINNLSISASLSQLILIDERGLTKGINITFKNTRLFVHKSQKTIFTSYIKFTYHIPEENYISRFLNNREFTLRNLKCTMQGTINNKDFNIDMVSLNLAKEQIIGMGIIKDFTERNPTVDIVFIPSSITLDKVEFLKNNYGSQGQLLVSFGLSGQLDNIRLAFSGHLDNCNLKYCLRDGEVFIVENMNGKIECKNDTLKLENIFLKLNKIPLNIKLKTNISQELYIYLNMTLLKDFLLLNNLPIEKLEVAFKGKIKKTLIGDLEIKTLYKRAGGAFEMEAHFFDLDFDYYSPKEKYFRAEKVELIKSNIYKLQKLNFTNLNSTFFLRKNWLGFRDINFQGYGGILKGEINIDLKDKVLLSIILSARQLDVKTLMKDTQITNKLLSGSLDTKLIFNNHFGEFLKGTCYIKDGIINLDALADAINFPSIKSINFDIMRLWFAISKNLIKIRGVKLSSSDIMLNAYGVTNSMVNGALNIKIRAELLRQSVQFKKLLDLTKIKKPYIDFKFLLGGIPEAIRFMWKKDEFKEKIENALPAGIKKSIQTDLDKMVEELFGR